MRMSRVAVSVRLSSATAQEEGQPLVRSYRHPNPSGVLWQGVEMAEEDVILIGLGVLIAAGVGYLIYWKLSQELDEATSNWMTTEGTTLQQQINQAMGGEQVQGSDVAPGSPDEPENWVGYE